MGCNALLGVGQKVSEVHIWLQWNGMGTRIIQNLLLLWEKEYVLIQVEFL